MDGALVGVGSHNWGGLDEIITHLLHLDDIQLPTLATLVKGAKFEVVKIEFWKSLVRWVL
jgi:hypothetical protein